MFKNLPSTRHPRVSERSTMTTRSSGYPFAWADRVTFEEIEASTGLAEVTLSALRRHQTAKAFKRWRARVTVVRQASNPVS